MSETTDKIDKMVEEMFKKYDLDQNGTLDPKELHKMLNEVYQAVGRPKTTVHEVKNILDQFDRNRDGGIDRKEMRAILLHMFNSAT